MQSCMLTFLACAHMRTHTLGTGTESYPRSHNAATFRSWARTTHKRVCFLTVASSEVGLGGRLSSPEYALLPTTSCILFFPNYSQPGVEGRLRERLEYVGGEGLGIGSPIYRPRGSCQAFWVHSFQGGCCFKAIHPTADDNTSYTVL